LDARTGDVERSVDADGFRVVADTVAGRTDDTQVFTLVVRGNAERLPSGTVHLRRHRRLDAQPRRGISPRVAFYLVTDRDVAVARPQLHVPHQICISTNKYHTVQTRGQPPPSAVNVTLPAYAAAERRAAAQLLLSDGACCTAPEARRPQLSIDISCPDGTQQQIRGPTLLPSIDGTDRQTDGHRTLHRPCCAHYAASVNKQNAVKCCHEYDSPKSRYVAGKYCDGRVCPSDPHD